MCVNSVRENRIGEWVLGCLLRLLQDADPALCVTCYASQLHSISKHSVSRSTSLSPSSIISSLIWNNFSSIFGFSFSHLSMNIPSWDVTCDTRYDDRCSTSMGFVIWCERSRGLLAVVCQLVLRGYEGHD